MNMNDEVNRTAHNISRFCISEMRCKKKKFFKNNDYCIKPLFSRTVIFAFLDFCGNSRVVNFAIFLGPVA